MIPPILVTFEVVTPDRDYTVMWIKPNMNGYEHDMYLAISSMRCVDDLQKHTIDIRNGVYQPNTYTVYRGLGSYGRLTCPNIQQYSKLNKWCQPCQIEIVQSRLPHNTSSRRWTLLFQGQRIHDGKEKTLAT